MALSLVTPPTEEPLSLDEVKAFCRVDVNDEDELLASLTVAARQLGETFMHRAFVMQTWDQRCDGFPYGPFVVPKAPLILVTSISYLDPNGIAQTWDAANYAVDAPRGDQAGPGRIIPAYGVPYPAIRSIENAVTVRFVAGYGSASAVPDAIKAAMKCLIAHWYGTREPVNVGVGNTVQAIPWTVEALLWPYKAFC